MIAAIVQARMTSSRLPGKVLKEVMGKPLLLYQIERLKRIVNIEDIIIATTTNKEDDPIVQMCKRESISCYRGEEYDVLDRYYHAGKKFGVDHIMRITADCPLIDPMLCDHIIDVYLKSNIDLIHLAPTFAEGLDCEMLSFKALENAWKNARLKSEREHVTLYLNNNPGLFKKTVIENSTDDSKYRFTVDELEDFEVVKAIIEALYKEDAEQFSTDEIKLYLDGHPEIFMKNAHIIRNEGLLESLKEEAVSP